MVVPITTSPSWRAPPLFLIVAEEIFRPAPGTTPAFRTRLPRRRNTRCRSRAIRHRAWIGVTRFVPFSGRHRPPVGHSCRLIPRRQPRGAFHRNEIVRGSSSAGCEFTFGPAFVFAQLAGEPDQRTV